jgi:hypothetical protein
VSSKAACIADEEDFDFDMKDDSNSDDGAVPLRRRPLRRVAMKQQVIDLGSDDEDISDADFDVDGATGDDAVASAWPAGSTRKHRFQSRPIARSVGSPPAVNGAASEISSPMSWRCGSKRISSVMNEPASQEQGINMGKRLRLDYEMKAKAMGLTLEEVHFIASQQRTDANTVPADDIRCVVRFRFAMPCAVATLWCRVGCTR